ncbi:MAG: M67 family metallopeptidase [Lachnospiraceae bacterium]|nr:M67 family metallopeptidase [Lachnospiraceae bacterium]
MDVCIDSKVYRLLCEYALNQYPSEACAVLLSSGDSTYVGNVKVIDNVIDSNRHFYIDPLKLFEAEKEALKEGYNIIGFFHSHPDCEAILSEEDTKYMVPGQVYLIAPVTKNKTYELRAYKKDLPDTKAYELSIGIKEEMIV